MELRDAATRRAHVLGRLSLFLDTLPQVVDSSELRAEIARLRRQIDLLEVELSTDKIQERLDSILSVIGKRLTAWADRLDLEHRGASQFTTDRFTRRVQAETALGVLLR